MSGFKSTNVLHNFQGKVISLLRFSLDTCKNSCACVYDKDDTKKDIRTFSICQTFKSLRSCFTDDRENLNRFSPSSQRFDRHFNLLFDQTGCYGHIFMM